MLVYWLMFLLPALFTFSPLRASWRLQQILWLAFGLIFTVIIGFRYQVGADWGGYNRNFAIAADMTLLNVVFASDPAYVFLNWLSSKLGWGIYGVNMVCGGIVMTGIVSFSRRQALPWLAILVAVPYMVIVVTMGYTRQSVAMGFEILALLALLDGRLQKYFIYAALGVLFHKSAIILLPLILLVNSRNRIVTLVWVGLAGLLLGGALVIDYYNSSIQSYIDGGLVSDGGPIRVAMNVVPASLLLLFRKKFTVEGSERRLWVWMAVLAIACIPLLQISSTMADRVALYFMPVQLFVFSRVHYLFQNSILKMASITAVVLAYGLVQWVWLSYSNQAYNWVPYQFFLLLNVT